MLSNIFLRLPERRAAWVSHFSYSSEIILLGEYEKIPGKLESTATSSSPAETFDVLGLNGTAYKI